MESKNFFAYGYVRLLTTLVLVATIVALASYAHLTLREARFVNMGPTTITVLGEGEVFAKPDVGQFTFTVEAEGDDAAAAQKSSAEAMNEIIAYLGEAGVEEKDIKTQGYNLHQKYRYEERICISGSFCPPGEQVPDGFTVRQSVSVKVRDLDNSGSLITGVGDRGATNISSLQFTIDDEDVLVAEAREQAIADAKEKAALLAEDLDVRLVRMVGFWEEVGGHYPYEGYGGDMMMAVEERSFDAVSPSMPVGENTVTRRVNITYEVK